MRVLFLTLALLAFGCRSEDLAKLDAPMRAKLEQLQSEKRVETLSFMGRCARAVDDPMRVDLKKAGAEVQSVTGDLFAARAASDRIMRIAGLDFVTQIELSQTLEPLGR